MGNAIIRLAPLDSLFTRSQVYADFSPASLVARHWNMPSSSSVSFLIISVLSAFTEYLQCV